MHNPTRMLCDTPRVRQFLTKTRRPRWASLALVVFVIGVSLAFCPTVFAEATLVGEADTSWKCTDDGSEPETTWRNPGYDDQKWPTVAAPLGSPDKGAAALNDSNAVGGPKKTTAYFRHGFSSESAASDKWLVLRVRGRDGLIAYLNGKEVSRFNLPAGPIKAAAPAQKSLNAIEARLYRQYRISADLLVPGKNVLAVEVHRADAAGAAIAFDAELRSFAANEEPVAIVPAAARAQSAAFLKQHVIPRGETVVDGYMDGGRGGRIADDGHMSSTREILLVDRSRDKALRRHLEFARSEALRALPEPRRAAVLAVYIDGVMSHPNGSQAAVAATDLLANAYAGQPVLLGEIPKLCGAGVCRHRSLLFKILADEAGLKAALIRGNLEQGRSIGGHAWNELQTEDGRIVLIDTSGVPEIPLIDANSPHARHYLSVTNVPHYGVVPRPTSAPSQAPPASPSLVVDLDARDATAGAAVWKNRSGGGDFQRVGEPKLETISGIAAVVFDGKADVYCGPVTKAALEGNAPRTIEAWVLNPRVDGPAETIVSWGRAVKDAESFSFNVGLKDAAVTLGPSGQALPWGEEQPMEDEWHHLAVTYDGRMCAFYDNGSKRHTVKRDLKTSGGEQILLAALNGGNGKPVFVLPKTVAGGKPDPKGGTSQVGGSICLASLRIYSGALTSEQVARDFQADAARFNAVPLDALDAQRSPRPTAFASTFSFGYASDGMPADDAQFEQLLKIIKELGFNVIHATYTPQRLALCRKHGIKMMIDALSGTDHHVFATPVKWKQAAISLRGNPDVWGYNLWNDPFGNMGGTLKTHIRSVRLWDPTHPAYCGTYHWPAATVFTNADMPGYYDFHWERGIGYHLQNCRTYMEAARRNNAMWGTWLSARPGVTGAERVNRSLWSANIGIAHGLKCVIWFLGQELMNPKTFALKPDAKDFAAIHAEIMPLKDEIMKISNPSAVYSTKITRDMYDKPLAGDVTAPRIPPFPGTFRARPLSGEFIAGVFDEKPESVTLFVANYNAYARQSIKLGLPKGASAMIFDRTEGLWRELRAEDATVEFPLTPGGGELIRIVSAAQPGQE